jgi:hypothetical protein
VFALSVHALGNSKVVVASTIEKQWYYTKKNNTECSACTFVQAWKKRRRVNRKEIEQQSLLCFSLSFFLFHLLSFLPRLITRNLRFATFLTVKFPLYKANQRSNACCANAFLRYLRKNICCNL